MGRNGSSGDSSDDLSGALTWCCVARDSSCRKYENGRDGSETFQQRPPVHSFSDSLTFAGWAGWAALDFLFLSVATFSS